MDSNLKTRRRGPGAPVAAIFIHAGAGYHSVTNEPAHLEACSEAARVAMRFLQSGADATIAVEAAIKSLEDKEITNAGYGSNLNIDGIVEGDATIVDHLGRSGACGAVPCIRNPISLAKIIQGASIQPLSLNRVPPNILVGMGAKKFAEEHGLPSVRNDFLVSRNARDRFIRWHNDLKEAEVDSGVGQGPESNLGQGTPGKCGPPPVLFDVQRQRDHHTAILTATWNEGQPDSPSRNASPAPEFGFPENRSPSSGSGSRDSAMAAARRSESPLPRITPIGMRPQNRSLLGVLTAPRPVRPGPSPTERAQSQTYLGDGASYTFSGSRTAHEPSYPEPRRPRDEAPDIDMINDTVGAIAIDLMGHIAAGSSSGGIGMKHEGRIGPAALVGIGTAVIPADVDDEDGVSVAAVTSGTGEHMATSFASQKCAERLYHCNRRAPGGLNIEEFDDDAIIESFVINDFLSHPGVKNQPTAGAIGVMAVKQTNTGYYLYFAHNTDSFALASMASTETEPLCTMSRMGKNGGVTRGGRRIRFD